MRAWLASYYMSELDKFLIPTASLNYDDFFVLGKELNKYF